MRRTHKPGPTGAASWFGNAAESPDVVVDLKVVRRVERVECFAIAAERKDCGRSTWADRRRQRIKVRILSARAIRRSKGVS